MDNQEDTNVMIDDVRELQDNINMYCELATEKCMNSANAIKEKAQWIHNDMTEEFYASDELIENASKIMRELQTTFMSTMLDTLSDIEELNKIQLQTICHDIKKHKDIGVRLDLTFRLTNLMIVDNLKKMIERFESCRKQNAVILSTSNMARETQTRIIRRIESITHEVDTLVTMTRKTADVVSAKFEMLSLETDKVESDLEKSIEQPLVSKRVLQEYNSKLSDNCKAINVLMEANITSIAHAQTKCENMQTVVDDGSNIICDNTTVATRKMEHIISELVAINETDEIKYREAEKLINRTKTLQCFKKSLQRQLKYPIYKETEHDTILTAVNDMINNHDEMTSSLTEKLNAHDLATVMTSSHTFSVLDSLDKETDSHTPLIVKDINAMKKTVEKYVDGLVAVKPSEETAGCSGVKHIPHPSLDMGGDAGSNDDSDA